MKRFFSLFLLLLLLLCSGCSAPTVGDTGTFNEFFAMDTIMSMDVYGEGGEEALARAEETIYRLEDLWAVTDENSEIWALDHSSGDWVDLSPETADLLSQALELCALTAGALDVTAYSAVQAWGFTTGEYRVPSQEELDALIPRIDYTQLDLDGSRARLPQDMDLDLGAVARRMAAWARGSCASGSPSCRAESTQALTMDTAWGYAIPTSSLAEHSSRRQGVMRSPASRKRAR